MKIIDHGADLASLLELVDAVPALIHTARPDGSIDFFNQRWLEFVGRRLEDLEGWKWTAAVHRDDVDALVAKWRACLASGEPFEFESRVRRADGQYRWMWHQTLPLRNTSGEIVKWYGSSVDIDDRKQEQLTPEPQRRQAYLDEAQRLSHTGSFGWNVSTDEHFWSDETFRIFEFAPTLTLSLPTILERVHPQDMASVDMAIAAASRAEGINLEFRLLMPDARIKYVHVVGKAARGETGTIEVIGAVMDVTARKLIEIELRRSKAHLADAQRLSQTGSVGMEVSTKRIFWSDEAARIYGYPPGTEPTPELILQRSHPDDVGRFVDVLGRAAQGGADFDWEHRLLMPDGSIKHLHDLAHSFMDEAGNEEIVGAIMDVTEHKLAEDALRESEEKFRLVVDNIDGLVVAVTPEGDVDFVNRQVLEYFGKTLDELKNWQTGVAVHPEDRDRVVALRANTIANGQPYDVQHRLRRSDGVYRWFHARGRPLRDAEGAIARWYVLLTDIDERKQAEQRLKEQEAEFRQMLDFAPQLVAVFGPTFNRLYANRMALTYLGVTLDEWLRREIPSDVHPEDAPRLQANVERTIADGLPSGVEVRARGGDGTYRWFLARHNPVRDDKGRIVRWYAWLTDIDDRKRAEERLEQENVALREEIDKASMFEEIVGVSAPLRSVLDEVAKVAVTDSTVLVLGETGTGKELIARAIHKRSRRSARAFVSVNCAAVPASLIASELFGHERGAFTGALQQRQGRFELAEGGTIFLDEIGDLPPETQLALLRVLQEREFERVGGARPIQVDVRVIAATNRDLDAAVAEKAFRADLFYRLNVFPIEVPPLRERRADIPLLVEYFTHRYAKRTGKRIHHISKETLNLLQAHDWPGNIRELQNIVERAVIVCDSDTLSIDTRWLSERPSAPVVQGTPQPEPQRSTLAIHEREAIEAALTETKGRVAGPFGAAARLGVPSTTLESKIKALNIDKRRFRAR